MPLLRLSRLAPRLLRPCRRSFSTLPPFVVFDRTAKKAQRNRAALDVQNSRHADYLREEIGRRMFDRLLDIKRQFNTVVELGSGPGYLVKHVDEDIMKTLIMCDSSEKALFRDVTEASSIQDGVKVERRLIEDEEHFPFENDSLDAVFSSLSLHWVNDLPGCLTQIRRALKPDGFFLGAMFGGETLYELRTSLQLAEQELDGGISPRVSPMTDVRDLGDLLSRAGFTLTTIDIDEIIVNYPSPFELMSDLQAMGESNAVLKRKPFLHRDTLLASAATYKEIYGNPDGSIPATFQVLYMIGWKPDPSQPKPLERGTGQVSLKEAFDKKKKPKPVE